jgi:NAD-dependent SIR2 family protein deacetylase
LLVQTLRHQKDIVVIAGAGISTAAGSKFLLIFCRMSYS